jgi:hypothetical protein
MKDRVLIFLAVCLAVVFFFMGMIWRYYFALLIGYPAGLLSFMIWRSLSGRSVQGRGLIPYILIAGLIASLSVLAYQIIKW